MEEKELELISKERNKLKALKVSKKDELVSIQNTLSELKETLTKLEEELGIVINLEKEEGKLINELKKMNLVQENFNEFQQSELSFLSKFTTGSNQKIKDLEIEIVRFEKLLIEKEKDFLQSHQDRKSLFDLIVTLRSEIPTLHNNLSQIFIRFWNDREKPSQLNHRKASKQLELETLKEKKIALMIELFGLSTELSRLKNYTQVDALESPSLNYSKKTEFNIFDEEGRLTNFVPFGIDQLKKVEETEKRFKNLEAILAEKISEVFEESKEHNRLEENFEDFSNSLDVNEKAKQSNAFNTSVNSSLQKINNRRQKLKDFFLSQIHSRSRLDFDLRSSFC